RWTGAPAMSVTAGEVEFAGQEHIGSYPSSDWAERAFCKRCGSHLYYRFRKGGDWFLWAGVLDDQTPFTLTSEIYIDSKPPGYAFAGEHPRLTEAEFLQSIGL